MVGLLAALRERGAPGWAATSTPTCMTAPSRCCLSGDLVPVLGFRDRRRPLSAHPSVVPFQFFATADGHIAIACPKEKFFTALVRVMGLPELATDERFASFSARGSIGTRWSTGCPAGSRS